MIVGVRVSPPCAPRCGYKRRAGANAQQLFASEPSLSARISESVCKTANGVGVTAARPDFAELDVFLGQHILLTLEQHFNPKIVY